jgi:2-polyprenyl-3-methyl-5-hydroxy-6-metoxy-1,4-benzoquinol methylase
VITSEHYYADQAACFCRGRLGLPLDAPDDEALALGARAGLRLFKWKRKAQLPRVRKVIGMLRGFAPESLLDVGSGRGTFLWPLLHELPFMHVTGIERNPQRASDLACVKRGGLIRLDAHCMDARSLTFTRSTFDGVTVLEVLEHIDEPGLALAECVRVARRFVIVSVPSREDENPEHLRLLTAEAIADMFERAGVRRVRFDAVHNHLLAIATL